jgi:error-prone DNA polymerase
VRSHERGRRQLCRAAGYDALQLPEGRIIPEELFAAAALLGLPALGVVDRGSVAGIVRAWDAERTTGVRAIIGCRIDLSDGTALLLYPTDRAAYGRMCRLLSIGKERGGRGLSSRLVGCRTME